MDNHLAQLIIANGEESKAMELAARANDAYRRNRKSKYFDWEKQVAEVRIQAADNTGSRSRWLIAWLEHNAISETEARLDKFEEVK